MDMIIAGIWMAPLWARSAGRAGMFVSFFFFPSFCIDAFNGLGDENGVIFLSLPCPRELKEEVRTNTHQHKESCQEASKVNDRIASALHEVIWVSASSADPVRQRRDDVGCNDDKREEVVP